MIYPPEYRMVKTRATLAKWGRMLGESETIELVGDLGWPDAASFSPEGKLRLALNDIQLVALAAAMLAYLEARGKGDAAKA